MSRSLSYVVSACLGALLVVGCGPDQGTNKHDGGFPMCTSFPADSDGDGISDENEGKAQMVDTDHDGKPDYLDTDSDNDTIPDSIESGMRGSCNPPADSDNDGTPDFRDLDSDAAMNDTVPDREEAGMNPMKPLDTDGDNVPDFQDDDNDNDKIPDRDELAFAGGAPAKTLSTAPDTDSDGTPDFLDIDSDADNVGDIFEGQVDTDMDGTPNFRDQDSDGDCIPDSLESGHSDPMAQPLDTDGDGIPDFLDRDSDNEGLPDAEEDTNCNGQLDTCETDPRLADTDGDGVNDLIERAACLGKPPAIQTATMCMCDGQDPGQNPRTRGDFVFTSDYMKTPDPTQDTLALATDVSQADVVLDIDTTASMGQCATDIASNLATGVVPQVKSQVPNVAFGVVEFQDFLDTFVVRYDHRIQTVNTMAGVMSVQGKLNAIVSGNGNDVPEAGWEAIYSIIEDTSLSPIVVINSSTTWNSRFNLAGTFPTTVTAGEQQGTLYGAGFRKGSVPIVVTVSDAQYHDRPGTPGPSPNGLFDYGSGTDCSAASCNNVPARSTVVARAQAIAAPIMGLAVTGNQDSKGQFRQLAYDTGAVVTPADFGSGAARPAGCAVGQCCTGPAGAGEAPDVNGKCPLSFTIQRSGGSCPTSSAVVSGIVALANGLKFDVHVEATDGDPGTVDNFIGQLVPNVTGMGKAAVCIVVPTSALDDRFTGPKAAPGADGVKDTFVGINGKQQICFDVVPKQNNTIMATSVPQVFVAHLNVIGQTGANRFNLGYQRDVFFLVPPAIVNGPIP